MEESCSSEEKKAAESTDEDRVDALDDELPLWPAARIRHPDDFGADWHPCTCCLSPLAAEFDEWLSCAECDGLDFSEISTLDRLWWVVGEIVMGTARLSPRSVAWSRTCAWCYVHGVSDLADRLTREVKRVWEEAESLERRIEEILPEGDNPDADDEVKCYSDEEFSGFLVTVIEPFIIELQSCVIELQRRFPAVVPQPAHGNDSLPAAGTEIAISQLPIGELEPADQKAYFAFAWAEKHLVRPTDRQAYQWLKCNGIPYSHDDPDHAAALHAYVLPSFETWSRQVRTARRIFGRQKNTPRAGRPHGRSVVPMDRLSDDTSPN